MKTPILLVGHMADNYARQIQAAAMMIGVSGHVVTAQLNKISQTAEEMTKIKSRMEIAANSINDLAKVETALKDKPASVNPVTRKFNFKKLKRR